MCEIELTIISKEYHKYGQEVRIVFSNEIAQVNKSSLIFTFKDDTTEMLILNPINFETKGNTISMFFTFNQTLESATLKIEQRNKSQTDQIKKSIGKPIEFDRFPIEITDITFFRGPLDETIKTAAKYTGFALKSVMGVLVLSNFPVFFTLLKFFQVLDFINYFNITAPGNVISFLEIFAFDLSQLLPNLIRVDEDLPYCNLHATLKRNEFECLFINNMGSQMIMVFPIIFIVIIIKLVKRHSAEDRVEDQNQHSAKLTINNWIKKKLASIFSERMCIELMLGSQIQGMFSFIISRGNDVTLKNLPFWPTISPILSFVYAGLIVGADIYLLLIYLVYFVRKQEELVWNEQKEIEVRKIFGPLINLFGDIKIDSKWTAIPFLLSMVRDFLFPIWLILFMDSPYLQTIPLAFFLCAKGILIIIIRPFNELHESLITSLTDFLSFLIMLLFSALQFAEDLGASDHTWYVFIGNPIIILLSVTIAVNFLYSVGTQIYNVLVKLNARIRKSKVCEERTMENITILNESTQNPLRVSSNRLRSRRPQQSLNRITSLQSFIPNGRRAKDKRSAKNKSRVEQSKNRTRTET